MTGSRTTRQGALVEAAVREAGGFRTAQEIHAALRAQDAGVGLATVYRHLQRLADAGVVDVLAAPDGSLAYRSCSTGHHHHLVCRECSTAVEVHHPSVERWAEQTARDAGFTDVTHTLEIFGRCARCARGTPPRRSP